MKNLKEHTDRMKYAISLLNKELVYFKDATPEARKHMKKRIPGAAAGFTSSLLTSLYDESQLEIFKTFT